MRLRDLFITPDDILMGFEHAGHYWVTDQYCCWRSDLLKPWMPFVGPSAWERAAEHRAAIALRIEPVEVEFADEPGEELVAVGLSLRGFGEWPPEHVTTLLQTPGVTVDPTPWALHQSPRLDAMCAWVADGWTSWVNARVTSALITNWAHLSYEQTKELAGIRALAAGEVVGAVMPLRLAEIPPLPEIKGVMS